MLIITDEWTDKLTEIAARKRAETEKKELKWTGRMVIPLVGKAGKGMLERQTALRERIR